MEGFFFHIVQVFSFYINKTDLFGKTIIGSSWLILYYKC